MQTDRYDDEDAWTDTHRPLNAAREALDAIHDTEAATGANESDNQ